MSRCFHVQNQHTDTFLAPAVDMLVILAPPHPPKYHDHQWIGSQFNRHNAGTVSAAPQRPKCQKHQRMDRHLFAVCRKRSHAVVQLPLPEFLNHIGSAQTEVFGRPAAAALVMALRGALDRKKVEIIRDCVDRALAMVRASSPERLYLASQDSVIAS